MEDAQEEVEEVAAPVCEDFGNIFDNLRALMDIPQEV